MLFKMLILKYDYIFKNQLFLYILILFIYIQKNFDFRRRGTNIQKI